MQQEIAQLNKRVADAESESAFMQFQYQAQVKENKQLCQDFTLAD